MLFNSERQTVWDWQEGQPSTCPLCQDRLVAVRPQEGVQHWRHLPKEHNAEPCPHYESEWRLRIKLAYACMDGYQIETPIELGGRRYMIDAMHMTGGEARSFVHTLTPYFMEQHMVLRLAGLHVKWIFDGDYFRRKHCKYAYPGPGMRGVLKPKSYGLAMRLDQVRDPMDPDVLIHVQQFYRESDPGLYIHAGANVWRPYSTEGTENVLKQYLAVDFANVEKNNEKIREHVNREVVKRFVKAL